MRTLNTRFKRLLRLKHLEFFQVVLNKHFITIHPCLRERDYNSVTFHFINRSFFDF